MQLRNLIPGTLRDSIFVLEGLLEQETGLNPTEIMTDTAGASDLFFGLFRLQGYQFSPRLADAGASVFWRIYPSGPPPRSLESDVFLSSPVLEPP